MKVKFYVVYRQYEDGLMTKFKRHKINSAKWSGFNTREAALDAINALPETHRCTEYRIVEILIPITRETYRVQTTVKTEWA